MQSSIREWTLSYTNCCSDPQTKCLQGNRSYKAETTTKIFETKLVLHDHF
jgi:hypothetical protein